MRVLVVDDSLTIRAMLRRVLAQDLGCEVTEAANGLDALEHLGRQRFDLMVLDMTMPIMDGIETLQAVRSSTAHARLPVVMLSGTKGEAEVRRVVELGITEYLTKPLSPNQMFERLSRVTKALVAEAAGHGAGPKPGTSERLRVLVAEQDADVRRFVSEVLGPHHDVETADSGAQALRRCIDAARPAPQVVLLGGELGPVTPEMLVAKIRPLPQFAGCRAFAVVQRADRDKAIARRIFDGVLAFTFVPEGFLHEFRRVVAGEESPLEKLLALRPSLQRDAIAATEQVFGMMLFTEVELIDRHDAVNLDGTPDVVHASLDLRAQEERIVLTLLIQGDSASARAFSAQMIGAPPEELQESDLLATAAEIANIIGGRLQNRMVEAGMPTKIMLPRTWSGPAEPQPAGDLDTIRLPFRSPKHAFEFVLTLIAVVIGEDGAAAAH
jgi:CheY-like chemotaxis protein